MNVSYGLGNVLSDGRYRVYIKFRHRNQRKALPLEVYLNTSEFYRGKSGLVIRNLQKAKAVQGIVDKINNDLLNAPFFFNMYDMTLDSIVMYIKGKKASADFFLFAYDWLKLNNASGRKNYFCALNSFSGWLNRTSIAFEEITPMLLTNYCHFLEGKPRAQSLYLGIIRHLWNEAEAMYDDMPRTPFKRFKVPKQKPVGKRAVPKELILKIFDYKGTGTAQLARDCFIMSFCLMGMNSADLFDCRSYKDGILSYDRMKTRARRDFNPPHMEIDVPPICKETMAKYLNRRNTPYVFTFHCMYKTKENFNRAINLGMRTMMKDILGKDKTGITYYAARHSWATIARNDLKVNKNDVNDALLHVDKSMDVTDLYILNDYTIVNEINQKVVEYVFGRI